MKAKLILKSLADLPTNTLGLAAAMPGRAMEMTKRALNPPVQATRRQMRAAQKRSADFIKDLADRTNAPFKANNFWLQGGLND